jgi:phosphatidylinositol glycan class P protein
LYVGSSAAFLMYILWAYVPARLLQHMGIMYYPDRWWALAVPCWVVVALVWIYVALGSWNTEVLTLGLGRIECLVDECGRVDGVGMGEEVVDWKGRWSTGTDAVLDVPIGGVCEILYGGEE